MEASIVRKLNPARFTAQNEPILAPIEKMVKEYVDDQMLITKCASVVICQFPRFPCKPIVLFQETTNEEEDSKTTIAEDKQHYGTDFDDFGEDVFKVPKVAPLILGDPANPISKTQALDNTAALDHPQ